MPTQIVIEIDSEGTIEDLNKLHDKLDNLTEFVLMVGDLWSTQMDFNFSSNPWPPLAAATITRKQAEGYPMDPLVRTGTMKERAVGGAWQASEFGNEAVAVLELTDYFTFHVEGTEFMPARDFTFLPDSFDAQVEELFYQYIDV